MEPWIAGRIPVRLRIEMRSHPDTGGLGLLFPCTHGRLRGYIHILAPGVHTYIAAPTCYDFAQPVCHLTRCWLSTCRWALVCASHHLTTTHTTHPPTLSLCLSLSRQARVARHGCKKGPCLGPRSSRIYPGPSTCGTIACLLLAPALETRVKFQKWTSVFLFSTKIEERTGPPFSQPSKRMA